MPLADCAGLNDPQSPAVPHVALQFTPPCAGSFETPAVTMTVVPTWMVAGGGDANATRMTGFSANGEELVHEERTSAPARTQAMQRMERAPGKPNEAAIARLLEPSTLRSNKTLVPAKTMRRLRNIL